MNPEVPVENKSFFTKKTIIIILLIFALAMLAVITMALYLSRQNTTQPPTNETSSLEENAIENNQQPGVDTNPEVEYVPNLESTAGWETYTNTKFNYSFQYPPNLESFARNPENGDEIPVAETSEIVVFVDPSVEMQNQFFVVHFVSAEASSSAEFVEEVTLGQDVQAFKELTENSYIDYYGIPVDNPDGRLELFVSKNTELRDRANTVLSTFNIQ